MGKTWRSFITGLSLILLLSCTSRQGPDWNGRIGTYTFDHAVTELGPPDRSTDLSNGHRVSEWDRNHRNSHISFGLGTGYYRRGTSIGFGTTVAPYYGVEVLRLTFDKDGILRAWEPTYK